MTNNMNKTALVTGATSGLGFETAVHLADDGFDQVIITGRNPERADAARTSLIERTGKDVFLPLALDLNAPASVEHAIDELAVHGQRVDVAILNAGMVSGSKLVTTDSGIEVTFASSLTGHHQLTMGLLDRDVLSADARIVIAGSEAARGDVPTFNPVVLGTHAERHFAGDRTAAAKSLIQHTSPTKYNPAHVYATAKLFVSHWSAELARHLPAGMTVNTVSPGSAPGTDAGRNANFFMRNIMMPVMKAAPKRLGMAASVPVAARRYVDASQYGPDVTGQFFASAPKKMTGPLHRVSLAHVLDIADQQAVWNAVIEVTGVGLPAHLTS